MPPREPTLKFVEKVIHSESLTSAMAGGQWSVYCGRWKEEVSWLSVSNEHNSENSVNYFISFCCAIQICT
jgi:hypothetical protein